MPKVSAEHKTGRRDEILNACETLYQTMGFREITLKEIGAITSFSRPSIYNYFKTKEEIFLGLLAREYQLWTADIQAIVDDNEKLTVDELCSKIASTLEIRENMLKISAMNLYEIEDNSSLERLEEFKVVFSNALETMNSCVEKFLPDQVEEKKQLIQYGFFPFVYGIYPYTKPTEKQKQAMENAGVKFRNLSVYDMTYRFLLQLFR